MQAHLRPGRVAALRRAVPQLTEAQLAFMQRSPLRVPEMDFSQEPTQRVLQEVRRSLDGADLATAARMLQQLCLLPPSCLPLTQVHGAGPGAPCGSHQGHHE